MLSWLKSLSLPTPESALPDRDEAITPTAPHAVLGTPLLGPYPAGTHRVLFGMGCFWGAEKKFWAIPGVFTTAVGYAGGQTRNATYRDVCSGRTGHTEVVLVVYDPGRVPFDELLTVFWENHDPTQGMRQGNDVGTQYRSAIYTFDPPPAAIARTSRDRFQQALGRAGLGAITTEIGEATPFYPAEEYHQQYLAKNPDGYCGLGGTGVACPRPPEPVVDPDA
jgi:peptide-methionine (S)-S-oxide reductase